MSTTETIAAAAAPVIDRMREDITAAVRQTGNRSWYVITNKEQGDAEIKIYEDIGYFGVTAKAFADDIEAIKAKTIHVRLNTYGGEAFDGIAIYNALRAHPANIVVHVDGIAASAGSVVAMSGDEIRMADNAFLMIHEGRGGVFGEADDMRQYADVLDKLNDAIALTYQGRAGKTRRHWREKMAEETWYTAEEAREEGLCDAVDAREAQAVNRFDFKIYNHVQHVPDAVRQAWEKPNTDKAPEASQRSDPPPAVQLQEPDMATETQPAPAQNSGGAANVQDPPDESSQLVKMTNDGWFKQGKAIGAAEATAKARDRLQEIVAACPGKPQMALDAFLNGQGPESVKLAYDAEARAEARAKEEAKEKDLKIKRLEALIATGGHSGVALRMEAGVEDDGDDSSSPKRPPKEQAEWEWDNLPAARKSASSKDIYVLARAAELDGTHRSFSREPVNA